MTTHASRFEILKVPADAVYPLRARLLLDGDMLASRLTGDLAADTLHLGILRDEQLVGAASVCRENCADIALTNGWRLRGIAIDVSLRGLGFGRILVRLCGLHAREQGGATMWCTARESAQGFYENLGFTLEPAPLSLPTKPGMSFHRMWTAL